MLRKKRNSWPGIRLQTVATSKLQPGNRVSAQLVPSFPFSISSYQILTGITGQKIIYQQVHADADDVAQFGHGSGFDRHADQ